MTLYRSDDDAATWTPVTNVYGGAAAYSSAALVRRTSTQAPGSLGKRGAAEELSGKRAGQRVGVLFEKDGYQSIALALIDQ
jgi:hypothetical protein